MDLDPCPSLAREVGEAPEPIKSASFVVVGASHVGRTTQALKQAGYNAALVTLPGWRVIKIKAPAMEAALQEALQEKEPNCTVVFQMLDSAFYYAKLMKVDTPWCQGRCHWPLPHAWGAGPGPKGDAIRNLQ